MNLQRITDILKMCGEDAMFRQIMTSATGTGVCVIVLGMAVFMIAKSTKTLKDETAGGNVL